MSSFDKPERPQTLRQIPERLIRLDRELKTERTKSVDTLYAVRKSRFGEDYRFKVTIVRVRSDEFWASCTINNKVHRRPHETPSGAYAKLMQTVRAIVSQINFERNLSNNLMSTISA